MTDVATNDFVETDIGLLPNDWKVRTLGDTCTLATGGTPSRTVPEYWNGEIPWVKTGEVNYTIISKTEECISKLGLENSAAKMYPAGTLLVAMYGQGVTRGRAGILGIDATINQACAAITVSDQIRSDFLFYALKAHYERIRELGHGANQRNLNMQLLRGVVMPIPPLSEQQAIAGVLRTVERAKEATETVIAAARQLKLSLMQHLFTYGPVPFQHADQVELQETDFGELPAHWKLVELGELARIGNGSTPKRTNAEYWDNGNVPWLTSAKIHEVVIDKADEFVTPMAKVECHLPTVKSGSLLVAITGQGRTLGNTAMVTFDTCISQHLAYIAFDTGIVPEFMLMFLQGQYQRLRQVGSAGGSTRVALTCGFLKSLRVPVPTMSEQQTIADALLPITKKVTVESGRGKAIEATFDSLLHDLMTGQRRLHDLDLEFAEEGAS
ncbi:MAG: restriction endonuclease subunit S [Planctomycetes bacterium]|nr:restriction endonuclease subunit S [Planctomycetota bacterium]